MFKINEYLKTAFYILLLLQIAPFMIRHIKHTWLDNLEPKNKIGYISIQGNIESSSLYNQHLTDFFKDNTIKAILLHIESQGGAAGSCQALAFDIENLKKEYPKPIITYTENICTSGAYQIASATDHIVATGSAMIGSIGAKLNPVFNIENLLKKYDIECLEISSGQFKNSLSPYQTLTEDQINMLQSLTDNTYQQLSKEIAYKRHLQLTKLDQWGQGKLFTGQQAYDLKLIDALGSKTTAINLLKKHIIPSDREIEWVYASTISWNIFNFEHNIQEQMQTSIYKTMMQGFCKKLAS